jgi:hypothetical protein
VRIKIREGTVVHHQRPLCESCRWSTVIRGARTQDEIVECGQLSYRNHRVPFPVTSCSHYLNGNQPTIKEMEEIAWILRSDPHRTQAGFVHASRLTEDERHVLEGD